MSDVEETIGNAFRPINEGLNNATGGRIKSGADLFRIMLPYEVTNGIDNMLTPPDYSGPLDAAAQQLDNEKRRRANEANRKEIRSSQLARLFLSEDGTNTNTPSNSFMG